MRKLAFSDPDYIGKSFKIIFDTFTDGSSDHLLSIKVKHLLKECCLKWSLEIYFLQRKIWNMRLILSSSVPFISPYIKKSMQMMIMHTNFSAKDRPWRLENDTQSVAR